MRSGLTKLARWLGIAVTILILTAVLTVSGFRYASLARETMTAGELAPAEGRWISTPSGTVFISEAGPTDGQPIILTHGTAAWSGLWRETLDALGVKGYHAVAIDLPPFGFSDRMGVKTVTRGDQAARIKGVMDAMGKKKAIVVGHSFGSGPAVEAAIRYPESILGLVLIDAALGLPPEGEEALDAPAWLLALLDCQPLRNGLVATTLTNPLLTKRLFAMLLYRKDSMTDAQVAVLQRPMRIRGSTEDFGQWLKYFVQPDRAALSSDPKSYRSLKAPVVLLWGDKDTITPLDQAERLIKMLPNSKLKRLSEVGHIPQIEDPSAFQEAFLTAVAEFSR